MNTNIDVYAVAIIEALFRTRRPEEYVSVSTRERVRLAGILKAYAKANNINVTDYINITRGAEKHGISFTAGCQVLYRVEIAGYKPEYYHSLTKAWKNFDHNGAATEVVDTLTGEILYYKK